MLLPLAVGSTNHGPNNAILLGLSHNNANGKTWVPALKRMRRGRFKHSFSHGKNLALFSGANIDRVVMATSLTVAGLVSIAGHLID